MDIMMREMKTTRITPTFLPTEDDAKRYVAEKLSKQYSISPQTLYEHLYIVQITKKVQVSYNSDKHLVVRIVPIIYAYFPDDYLEHHPELPSTEFKTAMEDSDTIIVFDAGETYAIIRFIKYTLKEAGGW